MALNMLNRSSESIASKALEINVRAAISLKDIMKTSLGPKGKLKMLVSGSGDITLTKDGAVLLRNMQIEHPTASLIARNVAAQDDITGDGSTSLVVFIGEMLSQAMIQVNEGVHPRALSEGIEIARKAAISFLDDFSTEIKDINDRELLCNVAKCSLRTKLENETADHLTPIIVDAVRAVSRPNETSDLFMVEVIEMEHKSVLESKLVRGIVLDHGFRHPEMPKISENVFILTCNVSLEYEKTEVNSQFYFSNAEQRAKMVNAERDHINSLLDVIVALKKKVCEGDDKKSFLVINQKGIDPLSLDILHKNGIVGLRRAKRRNMERLTLAFGGCAVNSFEGLTPAVLGFAEKVTEYTLGEERYTFVTGAEDARSVTILLKGPNKYTISRMKEALRDGMRAVKSALEVKKLVCGAGAFEAACHAHLEKMALSVKLGQAKAGVMAFATALFALPKAMAFNAGLDAPNVIAKLKDAVSGAKDVKIGIDLEKGTLICPEDEGIWDNFAVKRQMLHLGAIMVENMLLVDEIMLAGKVESNRQQ